MSAGDSNIRVSHDLSLLAPKFSVAVTASIAACNAAGFDAFVFEGLRSQELQALYYARGRTIIPPAAPVTNAASSLHSWHGYGLAVDVISASMEWDVDAQWFASVAAIFKQHGCKWGGDWKTRDLPHFQWGPCKPSPSDRAREILAAEGVNGVWVAVGAI